MKLNKNYEIKINLPENVKIEKKDETLFISGPLGITELNLKKLDPNGIGAISLEKKQENNNFSTLVENKNDKLFFCTNCKAFFGLVSSLIKNKIYGVTRGFLVYIRIVGVGYRAQLEGLETQSLSLKLGFSHDIKFKLPFSIRAFLLEPTLICIYGIDKNQVTQIACKIRQIKVPSVYKGKGIRFLNENINLKAGKRR